MIQTYNKLDKETKSALLVVMQTLFYGFGKILPDQYVESEEFRLLIAEAAALLEGGTSG